MDDTDRRARIAAQLTDELALRDARRAELGLPTDPDVNTSVIADTTDRIFSGSVIVRRTACETVLRALHPIEAPLSWWATPLGRATASVRVAETGPDAHVRNKDAAAMLRLNRGRVSHLVAEGKLEAYPDEAGAVRLRSVYARLAQWVSGADDGWDSRFSAAAPRHPALARGRDPFADPRALIEVGGGDWPTPTRRRWRTCGPSR